jgi:S-adenosylmethionine-diacylglycerol 3-amino-3-carboxypropyl transferase
MTLVDTSHGHIAQAVRQAEPLTLDGLLEGVFARMFRGLVYPQIWEDPVADMTALAIAPSDHVVCIASGGCNMMSYLTAAPAAVTAVDLSPAHVALGRLKILAAQRLPHHEAFHDFFARADRSENLRRYDELLAPALDPETRAWWSAGLPGRRRIGLFARGFHRHGALGRFIGAAHVVSRLAGLDFRPLLETRSLAEQRAFFEARVVPALETPLIRFLARRRAALFGLGIPPAQHDKLAADAAGDVLPVLRERLRRLCCDFPVSENYFAWQAFGRRYDPSPDAALPPYLDRANWEMVRACAPRARVLRRSLTDLLIDTPDASRDVYVLLDAQDWMSDDQLNALWRQITRTAAPGARVLFRTGGTPDILPGRVAPRVLNRWDYDAPASARAFAEDRSAIYGGVHLYRLAA